MVISATTGAVLLLAVFTTASQLDPLSDEFISLINSKQKSWKAGRNFAVDIPFENIKRLMGDHRDVRHLAKFPKQVFDADLIANLPEEFDPREKWPDCPTLNDIRDQASCGSCWAFGAVAAMTDRVCIHSNATKHFYFSAQDLVSCCSSCGQGCLGGGSVAAWAYWEEFGIVSGGSYNSHEGCRPYKVLECEHYMTGERQPCAKDFVATPLCEQKCEAGYEVEYHKDRRHGKNIYVIMDGEDHIKAELFTNGPVEASMLVFSDLLHYKSGVYSYTSGSFVYGHAVKMMGWGVENGQKYWLIANSFNTDWGDNGYFKILRGEDHLGIESYIVAGEPALDNY